MSRWVTRIPAGQYPAGMRVDVITLSATGGAVSGSRDSYLGGGGDGQWIRVRWPRGAVLAAMVRTVAELGELGIEPGNLVAETLACGQTTVYASGMTATQEHSMKTVRINTSDLAWIKRHGHGLEGPVVYGTDIKGVVYFTAPVEVAEVEHVTFAGAKMIRFDLGPDAPRDHNRYAMYPDSYLVAS